MPEHAVAPPPWLIVFGALAGLGLFPFSYFFLSYMAVERVVDNARRGERICAEDIASLARAQDLRCDVMPGDDSPAAAQRKLLEAWLASEQTGFVWDFVGAEERLISWLYKVDAPFFARGFAVGASMPRLPQRKELRSRIDAHCAEQQARAARGEPMQPLPIYPEVAAALQASVDELRAKLAAYDAIRIPFGILMWGWAAFELAGCFYLLVWLPRFLLARRRGQ